LKTLIPVEIIEKKIFLIRGEKVIIDVDLAELCGVEVKHLKRIDIMLHTISGNKVCNVI